MFVKIRRATIIVHLFIYLFVAFSGIFHNILPWDADQPSVYNSSGIEQLWLPERTVSPFLSVQKGFADSTFKQLDMQSPYSMYSSLWHGVIRGVSMSQRSEYQWIFFFFQIKILQM